MKRSEHREKTRKGLIVFVTGLMLLGGIAAAAWTATGTGSGYAKAGSVQDLTTTDVSASTQATLYPGGTGDVKISVANPNDFPVTVTAVAGNGSITSDAGANCDASTGVTFTDQSGLSQVIPASSTAAFTMSDAAAMSSASHNSCQDAVFTIPVTLTGTVG